MSIYDEIEEAVMMRDACARKIAEDAVKGVEPDPFYVREYAVERDRVSTLRDRVSTLREQAGVAVLP